MRTPSRRQGATLAVLAAAGLVLVVLSAIAVEQWDGAAAGALLGVLVVLGVLGLRQQVRYARRSAADLGAATRALASVDRRLAKVGKQVTALSQREATQSKAVSALSKDVTALTKTVTKWSKDLKVAEIETGIAALNRYVALGSDDTAPGA